MNYKSLFLVTLSMFIANSVLADSSEIYNATQAVAKALGIRYEIAEMKVGGKDVKDILLNYCAKNGSDCEEKLALNNDNFDAADEVTYGSTSMHAALKFAQGLADTYSENPAAIKKMERAVEKAFDEFSNTGAVFGYNGFNTRICGMIFTGLLIIDQNEGSVYEISPGYGDGC